MITSISARKHITLLYDKDTLKQRELETCLLSAIRSSGHNHIQDVREQFCEIDLSRCYWHDLGALLWLVALLNKLKRQGNEILLSFPEPHNTMGANLWHFLVRWKFFDTLALCVDDPVNLLRPEQVSHTRLESRYASGHGIDEHGEKVSLYTNRLLEMTTLTPDGGDLSSGGHAIEKFLGKYHDKVLVAALSGMCGWDLTLTKRFVQDVIVEGVRNAFIHGQGTFASIAMRVDKKNLVLAIGDNGVGIPQVLRAAFEAAGRADELQKLSDGALIEYFTEPGLILDSKVIELAVRKGVTSNHALQGLGLYYMKALVLNQGGELRVRSGRALVDFTSAKSTPKDNLTESPGTVFRIVTPLQRSDG